MSGVSRSAATDNGTVYFIRGPRNKRLSEESENDSWFAILSDEKRAGKCVSIAFKKINPRAPACLLYINIAFTLQNVTKVHALFLVIQSRNTSETIKAHLVYYNLKC